MRLARYDAQNLPSRGRVLGTTSDRTRRALVIGATGMLAGVCVHLAEQGWDVLVHGLRAERVEALVRRAPRRIAGFAADYQAASFRRSLEEALGDDPLDLAILWIHGREPELAGGIVDAVARRGCADVVQVFGSAGADPRSEVIEAHREHIANRIGAASCYRTVVLGWRPSTNGTRWLRNQEIARGVIDALSSEERGSVVGIATPWSDRP